VLNLLEADDVEGRESHQRRKQHDGSDVLHHTGLVVARVSARFLISRKIEQLIDISPGIFYGTPSVRIGIVTLPELQDLAAAIRTFWFASHGITTPKHRFYFKAG
jgi:hypothetical protein